MWNSIEVDARCVIGGITAIAEEKDVFSVCLAANGAWVGFFLLQVVFDPCIGVEFGNLFLVFDCVFGYRGTWRKGIST
jgi:hypothetical protein